MSAPFFYTAYGLHIKSSLELPELTAVDPADEEIDITIDLGTTPSELKNPTATTVITQAAPNEFLLTYKDVAKYYASNGNSIVIDPDPDADPEKVKLFLMGSVLSALLHQRNLWPLHASGIVVDGKCIAFSGHSGAGKSTTAGLLAKNGFQVWTDDVCAISINDEGIPVVFPGYPQLRLWKESLRLLKEDHKELKPVRNELLKYNFPTGAEVGKRPLPLDKIFILNRHDKKEIEVKEVKGIAKFRSLMHLTHRVRITKGQGNDQLLFEMISKYLQHVEVKTISHNYNKENLDDFFKTILGLLKTETPVNEVN